MTRVRLILGVLAVFVAGSVFGGTGAFFWFAQQAADSSRFLPGHVASFEYSGGGGGDDLTSLIKFGPSALARGNPTGGGGTNGTVDIVLDIDKALGNLLIDEMKKMPRRDVYMIHKGFDACEFLEMISFEECYGLNGEDLIELADVVLDELQHSSNQLSLVRANEALSYSSWSTLINGGLFVVAVLSLLFSLVRKRP